MVQELPKFGMRLRAALLCAVTSCAAGISNRVCFPAPIDSTCLTWRTDAKNITFTGVWPARTGSAPPQWGGWGLSQLTCGSMFPSSIFFAVKGPGGVSVEDRIAVAHAVPQCRKEQLSYVTDSRLHPDGSFNVTWTRPLVPPTSSGQPAIVSGNVTLIAAFFEGTPLDLRPCEPSGVPPHGPFMSATVELIAGNGHSTMSIATDVIAPVSGLVAAFPVCSGTYSPFTNLARVSSAGLEHFYGVSSPIGVFTGSAVDAAGRRLFTLGLSSDAQTFVLVLLDLDTGAQGPSCATGLPVPDNNELTDLNIAWDSNTSTLILAGCTDVECAGYVQVSRVDPSTCSVTPVVKVPTDPELSVVPSASAFDPVTNTFVMTLSQARGKGAAGPVLVAVDMLTGNVTHTLREVGKNLTVVSLVNAGPGRFLGLNASRQGVSLDGVSLVTYDSGRNSLRLDAAVPSVLNAVPNLAALGRDGTNNGDGDIYYFVALSYGGSQIVGLFAGNGSVASVGTFPGDGSQAPSAIVHV